MITSVWTFPGQDNETARQIRKAVFCDELGMDPEKEQDVFEPFSFQLALLLDDKPVAAGRFYLRGLGKAQLSRICVLPEYRRQGIGDGLIKILDFKAAMAGTTLLLSVPCRSGRTGSSGLPDRYRPLRGYQRPLALRSS